MSLLQALILGIVQGATEFLPVSSSGHLVLVPWLLGWNLDPKSAFVFHVLVQWGTLTAVIYSFRDQLRRLARGFVSSLIRREFSESQARLAWWILLASLPAAIAGLVFKSLVERAFDSPEAAASFLLITATILALAELLRRRHASPPTQKTGHVAPRSTEREIAQVPSRVEVHTRTLEQLKVWEALLIGLAQALALFPGLSRSGATISAGLTVRLERTDAARFSFLMAVPIMLGAGVVALVDLLREPILVTQLPELVVGFLAAAVVGAMAIRWLLRYLSSQSLALFSVYCALAGAAALVLSTLRG